MPKQTIELMGPKRVERSLNRMTLEIIEKHAGKGLMYVFGLNERGYKLAKKITAIIKSVNRMNINPIRIDVHESKITTHELDLNEAFVVLIDDVIFSGETLKKAMELIEPFGTTKTIKIAVLVDRGHRKFPIEPEFVGLIHPTKLKEHVEVLFPDEDGLDRVVLYEEI